jgi:preprotein translocase subunit YajC
MSSNSLTTFVLIALMAVAFYFLIIRPQRKRQQEQQRTMNALTPGTRVMTGSGLFGTIVSIGEKQAVLEISPGVELTVLKPAISRVVTDADEDVPADPRLAETAEEPVDVRLEPDSPSGDLGPTATDITPAQRTEKAPGTDPSAKE